MERTARGVAGLKPRTPLCACTVSKWGLYCCVSNRGTQSDSHALCGRLRKGLPLNSHGHKILTNFVFGERLNGSTGVHVDGCCVNFMFRGSCLRA